MGGEEIDGDGGNECDYAFWGQVKSGWGGIGSGEIGGIRGDRKGSDCMLKKMEEARSSGPWVVGSTKNKWRVTRSGGDRQ